jgi:two-component system CheB/CheR fusion protein
LLEPRSRERLITSFAASLVPGGHLLLGDGELAEPEEALFARLDPARPLYRKKRAAAPVERGSMIASTLPPPGPPLTVAPGKLPFRERRDQRLTMAQELLLDRYAPPSLLVDEAGQVMHCFGDAGRYLDTPRGRPSLAVLDMVKDVLRAPLASAINRAKRTGQPVTLERLPLAEGPDAPVLAQLVVEAPSSRPDAKRCLLVSFADSMHGGADPSAGADEKAADQGLPSLDQAALCRLDALERDLRFGEESLKETIHGLEATNAALIARNRELEVAGETADAGLRALRTTGIEQQRRIEILVKLGQELERLVEATGLAAVLLDPDLSIRRYTPAAARYFNLLPQDIGRPLGHVTHRLTDCNLVALLEATVAGNKATMHDLETTAGKAVRLTVTPIGGLGESPAGIALAVAECDAAAPAAMGQPFPDPTPPPS